MARDRSRGQRRNELRLGKHHLFQQHYRLHGGGHDRNELNCAYGGHTVERESTATGLFRYRIAT